MSDEEPVDIMPVMRQRLAWDIVPCEDIEKLWAKLDLVPPGEEVAEAEHQESHRRMITVAPLITWAEVYIALTTDIISRVMIAHLEERIKGGQQEQLPEQALEIMTAQNQEVVRGAVYPILAHMLEMQLIEFGPKANLMEGMV